MFQYRLKELRESHGFKSQKAFADVFGVAQSTVAGWESGKREPNYDTTKKLARFFNVPIDYLLCMPGVPNIYLSDSQQVAIYEVLLSECARQNITQGEAIVRSHVSYDFFPRLSNSKLHQASEADLLAVASFLGVRESIEDILSLNGIDEFTYAMREEVQDLSESDKALLISMARQLRAARQQKKENG